MSLAIQIRLLCFSFFYGFAFSFFLTLNYSLLHHKNKYIKIISTFLITLISSLLYFIEIKKINHAILHYYSFLFIFLGFLLEHFIEKKFEKYKKK